MEPRQGRWEGKVLGYLIKTIFGFKVEETGLNARGQTRWPELAVLAPGPFQQFQRQMLAISASVSFVSRDRRRGPMPAGHSARLEQVLRVGGRGALAAAAGEGG